MSVTVMIVLPPPVPTCNKLIFESFIFELEKNILRNIIAPLQGKDKSYLDFACGTGRIISFVSENFTFGEYVGIDSSPTMIKTAREKTGPTKVEFISGNVLEDSDFLANNYFDVVSAFRLILNLEPENRYRLLQAIHKTMRSGGVFIVNNHMNRFSVLGMIALSIRKILHFPLKNDLQARQEGKRRIINTMSEREVRKLLKDTGFEVIGVRRFILFPGHKNCLALPRRVLFFVELLLSKIPLLNLFGKDQIYVCFKK